MKYSAKNYAKALLDLSEESGGKDTGNLVKKFVKVLEKNNDLNQLDRIKIEVSEIELRKKGLERIIVKHAGHVDKEAIRNRFGEKVETVFEEIPSLVGGVQIFIGDKRIDNTLAGRLSALKKIAG